MPKLKSLQKESKLADLEREFTVMFGKALQIPATVFSADLTRAICFPVEKSRKAILWEVRGAAYRFRKKIAEFLMEILLHAGGHMVAAVLLAWGLLAAVTLTCWMRI